MSAIRMKPENSARPLFKIAVGSVLLCCTGIACAQISLSTVVDSAQRNSSAVRLAVTDVSKAEAILAQSRDVYIPNLVIGSSVGPPSIGFPSGQPSVANASMQSLAFSLPQRRYIEAARAGYHAASLALKDAREQVALDASIGYIELDTVNSELEAAHQQAAFASRLVKIEEERAEAGVDPLSELLQSRLKSAQLNLNLLHLISRSRALASQISALTGLPIVAVIPDHSSIPQVPEVKGPPIPTAAIESAQEQARSKQLQARGDFLTARSLPTIAFGAQYNRDSTALNNYAFYYKNFKADNFSAGFSIQLPLFDVSHRAKARETAAEALRATIEAEQAQRQNDVQIATLEANIAELDAQAEVAGLKQQISQDNLKAVSTQLALGNGSSSAPQLSPEADQLARIEERQRFVESLDAGFDLTKARLSFLRAVGHMEDWIRSKPLQ